MELKVEQRDYLEQEKGGSQAFASSFLPVALTNVFSAAANQLLTPKVSCQEPERPDHEGKAPVVSEAKKRSPESSRDSSPAISAPSSPRSVASTATTIDEKLRRRSSRMRTTYNFAHPLPTAGARHTLHLRPKILLQIHECAVSSRPRPAYDVVPSTKAPARLARKFAPLLACAGKLGPDDVVVMEAEEYDATKESDTYEQDPDAARRAVGVICVGRKVEDRSSWRTEICMDNGVVWEAKQLPSGSYEFTSTDSHGLPLKARWVLPSAAGKRRSSQLEQINGAGAVSFEDKKFSFSTITAGSRRHPIVASMMRGGVNIYDQYSLPPPTAQAPTTPSLNSSADTEFLTEGIGGGREQPVASVTTDENLRKFILVSSIWVAFRENWSTAFKYNSGFQEPSSPGSKPSVLARASISLPVDPVCHPTTETSRRPSVLKLLRTSSRSSRNLSFSPSLSTPRRSVSRTNSTGSSTTTRSVVVPQKNRSHPSSANHSRQTSLSTQNTDGGTNNPSMSVASATILSPILSPVTPTANAGHASMKILSQVQDTTSAGDKLNMEENENPPPTVDKIEDRDEVSDLGNPTPSKVSAAAAKNESVMIGGRGTKSGKKENRLKRVLSIFRFRH